jgi:hypothetical protein
MSKQQPRSSKIQNAPVVIYDDDFSDAMKLKIECRGFKPLSTNKKYAYLGGEVKEYSSVPTTRRY